MKKTPGTGFARRITKQNIKSFEPLFRTKGQPAAEEQESTNASTATKSVDPAIAVAEALFKGAHLKVSVPFKPPRSGSQAGGSKKGGKIIGTKSSGPAPAASAPPVVALNKGPLLWKKRLSKTDAQRQIGHPTGDLRLTQAKFKKGDEIIDQTTYFRNDAFVTGSWSTNGASEVAEFDFDVVLLGQSFGIQQLTITHKPSGEAGQGNYTSGVRWGNTLLETLREQIDISGKLFELYGPPIGAKSPYFIVVT